MALKKSEKRLLSLLGIVLFIFVIDQFVCQKKEKTPPPPRGQAEAVNRLNNNRAGLAQKAGTVTIAKVEFDTWGRDPFNNQTDIPVASKAVKQEKKPNVQGIFWKQGKGYVLVDDTVIGEGEESDGLRIESIQGNQVTYTKNGRRNTLVWGESL